MDSAGPLGGFAVRVRDRPQSAERSRSAGIGRRTVAHGIDAVVPLALLALALAQAIGSVPGPTPCGSPSAAVLLVMIQLVVAVPAEAWGAS